jgi:hypothetical protein
MRKDGAAQQILFSGTILSGLTNAYGYKYSRLALTPCAHALRSRLPLTPCTHIHGEFKYNYNSVSKSTKEKLEKKN